MEIVRILVTGTSQILMHNPSSMRRSDDTLQRGGKKIPLPLDEARASLYADPKGQLYIKSDSFREAGLIAAGDIRDPTKKGRATMTKRFAASVFLCSEYCLLHRSTGNHAAIMRIPEPKDELDMSAEWAIDIRRVVVQKQGILRARAKIEDWCCILPLEYDPDMNDPNLILAVIAQAGKFPGILDYRVGKKGMFGRFTAQFANGEDFSTSKKGTK